MATQSPMEETKSKKLIVSTTKESSGYASLPSGLDMLFEASKTPFYAGTLKSKKVPLSKDTKAPEHLKKQYQITIDGKEAFASRMELQKIEKHHQFMNKITNPSPSPSKKRSGQSRLAKERKEIADRQEQFEKADKTVKDKKWDLTKCIYRK